MLRPIGCCPGTLGSEARWTPRGPPVDPPWTPGPAVHHLTAGILLVGLFGTVLGFREVLDAIATMGAEVPGSASRSAVARGSSSALIPVVWAGLGACVGHGAGALAARRRWCAGGARECVRRDVRVSCVWRAVSRMQIEIVTRLEQGARGEDRLVVLRCDDACVIVIADGAGGTGSGGAAAAFVCARAEAAARRGTRTAARWVGHLVQTDLALRVSGMGGESTAVVVEIDAEWGIGGASVGDSGAHAITVDASVELTGEQHRKPLVGSGRAVPVGFGPVNRPGQILVASDQSGPSTGPRSRRRVRSGGAHPDGNSRAGMHTASAGSVASYRQRNTSSGCASVEGGRTACWGSAGIAPGRSLPEFRCRASSRLLWP